MVTLVTKSAIFSVVSAVTCVAMAILGTDFTVSFCLPWLRRFTLVLVVTSVAILILPSFRMFLGYCVCTNSPRLFRSVDIHFVVCSVW